MEALSIFSVLGLEWVLMWYFIFYRPERKRKRREALIEEMKSFIKDLRGWYYSTADIDREWLDLQLELGEIPAPDERGGTDYSQAVRILETRGDIK